MLNLVSDLVMIRVVLNDKKDAKEVLINEIEYIENFEFEIPMKSMNL